MPERADPDNVGFLIADVTRLIRAEMDRRITEEGIELNPGDARTLTHAARCGPLRQNLLAERIGVEAMTVSASLDRLEALGLVERQTDSADRRAKLVHVTQAGEAMLERIRPIGARLRADMAQDIAPEDWQRFLDTLKNVRTNLTVMRDQFRKESAAA
ncbi:MarR family winged helix-turn-helix transcriptional regulator [Mesorhizobium sp. LHD-90]|uniref:MarR family winged helix-turn-helix transcriptional regulator n=1 Tax=Mesorhizobium sp. LHD-90 TaxID=3071414 RepID=UPI0027E00805|nr:MarR family winged helix-turn-helix transcriptional regulator [Mesorhizobium sp. LHD-90]MDQ6432599.1 MarR family winged helix-turn-helix transcriptional regulator [Mesorhizobium sp. LHD-90]